MKIRVATMLVAVLAGGTALAGGAPAQAVPGIPSPVFDPDSVSWLSLRNQSSAGFAASFAEHSGNGYLITDLDIDVGGDGYRVGSVWQKNLDQRGWKELRDLDLVQFQQESLQARRAGLRMVEQETYLLRGSRRYAAVWVENVEQLGWAAYGSLTSSQFSQVFQEQRSLGRMPIDIDVRPEGSAQRYAVIWVDNAEQLGWRLWRDQTAGEFIAKHAGYVGTFRMLAFDSLLVGGTQRYAGIWVENRNGRASELAFNLTAQQFANHWNRYLDKGFRLVSYDRYETLGGTRYAGVWRQNSDRPDWPLKGDVDGAIATELATTDVPGISVAVFHDGQPVYRRGFGFADIDDNVWVDSRHVGRLASVSKAVAGVLTMQLVEQDLISLDDLTRSWVPQMPVHHTHTVGQLVSNRGCVGHWGDFTGEGWQHQPYPTALEAAEVIWDDPLQCTPPAWKYSTPGYTMLGAALEAAGGDDIHSLVRTQLTDAYGLGTLAPQDLSDGDVRWMSRYYNGEEIPESYAEAKLLGGGLVSNAYDLARFGAKLAAGEILPEPVLTELWTKPDNLANYAYGWDVGTLAGHDVVGKAGSTSGWEAYLRIYPEDEVVVAVLMNGNGPQNPGQLSKLIGGLVLDSLP